MLIQILLTSKGISLNPITSLYYVAPCCLFFLIVSWIMMEYPILTRTSLSHFDFAVFGTNFVWEEWEEEESINTIRRRKRISFLVILFRIQFSNTKLKSHYYFSNTKLLINEMFLYEMSSVGAYRKFFCRYLIRTIG